MFGLHVTLPSDLILLERFECYAAAAARIFNIACSLQCDLSPLWVQIYFVFCNVVSQIISDCPLANKVPIEIRFTSPSSPAYFCVYYFSQHNSRVVDEQARPPHDAALCATAARAGDRRRLLASRERAQADPREISLHVQLARHQQSVSGACFIWLRLHTCQLELSRCHAEGKYKSQYKLKCTHTLWSHITSSAYIASAN